MKGILILSQILDLLGWINKINPSVTSVQHGFISWSLYLVMLNFPKCSTVSKDNCRKHEFMYDNIPRGEDVFYLFFVRMYPQGIWTRDLPFTTSHLNYLLPIALREDNLYLMFHYDEHFLLNFKYLFNNVCEDFILLYS